MVGDQRQTLQHNPQSHGRNENIAGGGGGNSVNGNLDRAESGATSERPRNVCMRAIRYHHRLCDSPALQEADLDGDHGKHGAMALASPDERPTANALVATREHLML